MASNPHHIRVAEDVLRLPLPNGVSGYELVDGKPIPVTPVSPTHGRHALELARRIGNHLREHAVAGRAYVEAGFVLGLARDPERLRAPDVSYVSDDNLRRHGGEPARGFFHLTPDLALEIESPDDGPRSLQQRVRDYLEAGVSLVWVLHPRSATATVYRPDAPAERVTTDGTLDGHTVLPGLRIPLREVLGS